MENETKAAKKQDKTYGVRLIFGLFLMFGFGYVVPAWGGITQSGIAAIGVFLGMLFLTSTGFGLIFPSLVGLCAMQMTGYYTSVSVVAESLGSTTAYQLIGFFALAHALRVCGAADIIARWFITRKFTQGRPYLFTLMFMLGAVAVGALMELGGIIFYYAILESICDQLEYETTSKWNKLMVMGVNICCCIGFTMIPFKGMQLVMFGTYASVLANTGYQVNYGLYMLASVILGSLVAVTYTLLLRFLWKVDVSRLKTLDVTTLTGGRSMRMNKEQIIISLANAIAILYSILRMFLPAGTAFTTWYTSISQHTWTAVVLGLLFIIRLDGKPLLNAENTMKEGISWSVLLSTAAFVVLGSMISSGDLGILGWLQGLVGPAVARLSFPMFMLLIIAATFLITNFFSSMATGLIMCTLAAPIAATYAATLGINPTIVGYAILGADMFAYLTMAASATSPLFLTHKAVVGDNKLIWGVGSFIGVVFILLSWAVNTTLAYLL